MKTRKPLQFATIPEWAISTDKPSRHTIASAFCLAELNGIFVRLSAATQRSVFGAAVFGKCEMLVAQNGISVRRSAAFGTDSSYSYFEWQEVEAIIRSGRRPIL